MNNIHDTFKKRKTQLNRIKNICRPINRKFKVEIPEGLYDRCPVCEKTNHVQELIDNLFVCSRCNNHLRLRSYDRVSIIADKNSFVERGRGFITTNPLEIDGYEDKVDALKENTGLEEAYIYGYAEILGEPCVLGVMDSYFLMGSMGSVVGEKVTESFEYAIQQKLPIILFTASGGARMQEGILSLMQMAKTSGEVARFSKKGGLYITFLTNPTTGGVSASFAMLGDIQLAEPNALIGFAGPRVIEQTINQKLPEGFQKSEFLLEKGFVDAIVDRKDQRDFLKRILVMHKRGASNER